jgi:hypothetical protein
LGCPMTPQAMHPPDALRSASSTASAFEVAAVVLTLVLGALELVAFVATKRRTRKRLVERLELWAILVLLALGSAEGVQWCFGRERDDLDDAYRTKLEEEVQRLGGRRLSDAQVEEIANALRLTPGMNVPRITVYQNDSEASALAERLVTSIKSGGWVLSQSIGFFLPDGSTALTVGICIQVKTEALAPPGAELFLMALRRARVPDVRYCATGRGPDNGWDVFVGHRPNR